MKLNVGDKAPDFNLPDQDGKMHTLKDYAGKWVLIYFYPKDNTPGCTKEACGLRDGIPDFGTLGMEVLGVSKDSEASHQKFIAKYDLNFSLLADTDTEMMQAYGAWGEKSMFGKKYMGTMRNSYLIDPKGNIAKIYEKVKPAQHAEQVKKDLQKLQA